MAGTELHAVLVNQSAAIEHQAEEVTKVKDAVYSFGSMGMMGKLRDYGQMTAMMVICIVMMLFVTWNRQDQRDGAIETRRLADRLATQAEAVRSEDRADRAAERQMFQASLQGVSADSRANATEMRAATQEMRTAVQEITRARGSVEKATDAVKSAALPNP